MSIPSFHLAILNDNRQAAPPPVLLPANNFPANNFTATTHSPANEPRNGPTTTAKKRPFPVMPFVIIKEEPVDYEILSDITIETNTEETYDERLQCRNGPTPNITNGNENIQRQRIQAPAHGSMVTLNDKSLLISTHCSDVDYISAYLPTPSISEHSPVESTSSLVQNGFREPTSTPNQEVPTTNVNTRRKKSVGDVSETQTPDQSDGPLPENDTAVSRMINNGTPDSEVDQKPNRKSLQRALQILRIDMQVEQSALQRDEQRGSRTKDGSLPKKNYQLFFGKQLNPLNQDARNEMKQKIMSRTLRVNHTSAGGRQTVRDRMDMAAKKPAKKIANRSSVTRKSISRASKNFTS